MMVTINFWNLLRCLSEYIEAYHISNMFLRKAPEQRKHSENADMEEQYHPTQGEKKPDHEQHKESGSGKDSSASEKNKVQMSSLLIKHPTLHLRQPFRLDSYPVPLTRYHRLERSCLGPDKDK